MDITEKLSPPVQMVSNLLSTNFKLSNINKNNNNNNNKQYIFSLDNLSVISNYLIIDSGDRNWYSQIGEHPTLFSIRLGDSSINNKNCHIKQLLKNIVSIRVDKLFMPNRLITTSYDSNTNIRLNDNSFLTIQFQNIEDTDFGTNNNTDQSLAIMTPLIPLPTSLSNITNLEFKNANNQQKNYYGTPKASLDRLDTLINTATGERPHFFNDVLVIDRIFSNYTNPTIPLSNTTIVIRTTSYFNSNEYLAGDLIKIQNYEFHNSTNNECFVLNNFINRNEGHRIIHISSNTATTLYNQIHIPAPQYYSSSTGNLTYETWYSDFLTKNNFTDLTSDIGGKLINTNLQTKLLISITTLAYN